MTCADDDDLAIDTLLQRYLDDACTAEERARIERALELMAHAHELRRLDQVLRQVFAAGTARADDRPDPAELIAYVDGKLDEQRRKIIEQRMAEDAELRAEVELLRRMGAGGNDNTKVTL
jgi:anti-sigma factor RsiW